MRYDLTREDFVEALRRLDAALGETGRRVTIRAIGGFSLVWWGIREGGHGVTSDIDTVTPTYPPAVRETIGAVARELDLTTDWVNNQTVFSFEGETTQDDCDAFDAMTGVEHVDSGLRFRNIDLYVADVESLVKSKAYAVCAIGMGRDGKDLDDLVAIFRYLGCGSLSEAMSRFPWLADREFDRCVSFLRKWGG